MCKEVSQVDDKEENHKLDNADENKYGRRFYFNTWFANAEGN